MKKLFIALFLIGATISTEAQTKTPVKKVRGNGNVMERVRKLPAFKKIEISGNIDVLVLNNDYKTGITIKGDANLQPLIKSKVENNTLSLSYDNNIMILAQTEPLKVIIPAKNFDEIILSNGAKISNMGTIEALKLKITASEDSQADLRIKADELFLTVNNDAEVILKGSVNIAKINFNGSRDLNTKELSSFYTELELNGTGNVYSNTVSGLDGNLNSSGNLYYKATKTVNLNQNSSGKIIKY